MIDLLEEIGSDPNVMRWFGAVVIAALGFGFMRIRRNSVATALLLAGESWE